MICTVATLAGRTWRGRIGYAMLVFGVWDILYYVFLRPLSNWPRSLLDWDILFSCRCPGGALFSHRASSRRSCRSREPVLPGAMRKVGALAQEPRLAASGIGAAVALYTFMADALAAASGGVEAIRQVLPAAFNWPTFLLGLALLAAPLGDMIWHRGISRVHARAASLVPAGR